MSLNDVGGVGVYNCAFQLHLCRFISLSADDTLDDKKHSEKVKLINFANLIVDLVFTGRPRWKYRSKLGRTIWLMTEGKGPTW